MHQRVRIGNGDRLAADTASHARGVGADDEFRRGFDILVAGLQL